VVRSRSAKPLFAGSIPAPASHPTWICSISGFWFYTRVGLNYQAYRPDTEV